MIYKHRAVLILLEDGIVRTGLHTVRLLTVVAVNGQKPQAQIGKLSLLPLIHTHVFKRPRFDVVPFFTRNRAGVTTRTSTLIE
jgi:hypothetical protein